MPYRPRHFIIQELVCPHVHTQFGEVAWQFFDDKLLITLDMLRDQLGPIYVNSWDMTKAKRDKAGIKEYTQRGLRCTMCQLVKDAVQNNRVYMSPHITSQGVDLDVKGMTAAQVRLWITKNYIKMPFPVRLEKSVNWVHIDVRDAGQGQVYLFNP